MSKIKCQACGDTGQVGVYIGDGEFEFHPCEWCSVYNDQHRPTKHALDGLKQSRNKSRKLSRSKSLASKSASSHRK